MAPLVITRTFVATPEQVFDAWTTPAQFASWFGTKAIEVPLDTLAMDVRPGGSWTADMHIPGGRVIHWAGEYVTVDRPALLVMTITDNPDDPAREPLTVEIRGHEQGAEMTLTQAATGFSDEQREGLRAGYNGFFDDMAELFAAQR